MPRVEVKIRFNQLEKAPSWVVTRLYAGDVAVCCQMPPIRETKDPVGASGPSRPRKVPSAPMVVPLR
ncbi:hypothetical protein [Streptomyces sp. NPDC048277]|uniref:hypothetical protein n=1 Tax=Streptomyces sp. NPDC048277 TaxID=3155027 RepID=UPI0033C2CABE